MFRIESPDEVEIDPAVGLEVGVPTDVLVPDMKLFSRDEEGDWVLEDDLIETPELLEIAEGKQLFEANCTSCHKVDGVLVGPSLANITKYRNTAYLRAFTRNSAGLILSGNCLAIYTWEMYNKQAMTAFPDLSVAKIDAIYAYIESETELLGLTATEASIISSCRMNGDTVIYFDAEGRRVDSGIVRRSTGSSENYRPQRLNYLVKVPKFCWYNIDMFVNRNISTQIEPFTFQVTSEVKAEIYGNLILKNRRAIIPVPTSGKPDWWGFQEKGKLTFPIDEEIRVAFIGETKDGQLLFAYKDIRTKKTANEHSLKLELVSEEEIKRVLDGERP